MGAKQQVSEPFSFHPFKDLKIIIERKRKEIACKSHAQKKDEQINDEEFFKNAMNKVREIEEFRKKPVYTKKSITKNRNPSEDCEVLEILKEIVTGTRPVNLPDTPEYVEWMSQDYRGDITKKLHEGRISVQDSLDLHGMTVEEARKKVKGFLNDSLRKGFRCIKIIHGRGLRSPNGPVLKNAVVKLLSVRNRKHIIAFVSARQCDGGLGALYVLLHK